MINYTWKPAVDRSVILRVLDSTDGTPEAAFAYDTSGIDLWYRREGATVTSITEVTRATADAAHADGGVIYIRDGYFRLDLPDAATAAGATGCLVGGTATGMVIVGCYVHIVAYDPADTVRLGLTALPNAAADAAGGLPISDAGALDLDSQIKTDIDALITGVNVSTVVGATPDTKTDIATSVAAQANIAALIAAWVDAGRLDAILDSIAAAQLAAGAVGVKKNTAFNNFTFCMRDTTTKAPKTGLTVAGLRSLDAAATASVTGAIAEIGTTGVYQFDAAAGDTNGDTVTWIFSAAGADTVVVTIKTRT